MGIYITLPLYITLSFCILLFLYLLFNLISLLYLLYYYIYSITRRVFHTLRGLFTSYLSYLSTFTVFLHLLFSLYYIFTILPYSLYLSSLLPVGCYTPYGVGLHLSFSLYILSLFTLFFLYYTRSIRPSSMAHIPTLLPVGCFTPYGVSIHLLFLYLYLLYRIPYSLYVLYHIYLCFLFYTHSFSLSCIVYTYYIPPLLPVGLHPTGYLLYLLDMSPSYLISSVHLYFIHSYIYSFYLPIHFVINTYFNIYHISINYIYYYIII